MNQEKQPESLRLADALEYISNNSEDNWQAFDEAAAELRRLHALVESQKEEVSSLYGWLAECRDAFSLPAVNTELDHHFCGAMTDPCEVPAYVVAQAKSLEAQLSAIGAGGVEPLRKREQECGNCFEGKSDLDHTCRKCGGSGAAAPAQAQDDRAAFKAYLQECDDCAIVPDVAGAFHAAWQKRAAPAQAKVSQDHFAPAQEHATQLAGQGQAHRSPINEGADRAV